MRQFGPDRFAEIRLCSFEEHESARETLGRFFVQGLADDGSAV